MLIGRDEFIGQFAISIGVHSLKLWHKRSETPPFHVSTSIHRVIGTGGGQLQLNSAAFATIIHPVIEALHRQISTSQRPEPTAIAGLVYDALASAGIEVTLAGPRYGHSEVAVSR